MHERLLERSKTRSLRGPARLTTAAGKVVELSSVTRGKPAVVIFWSRNCGGAIEELPAITAAAERLHRSGTPVVLVVDETPTSDVAAYLTRRQWPLPIYHDVDGNVATAFANFGTPMYYVLDSAGRIRFDYAEDPMLLLAQVGSLKPAGKSAATGGPDS
jgi:thiol-disulfide isomerase/thioredoxin